MSTSKLNTVFLYLVLYCQLANTGQALSNNANLSDGYSQEACTSSSHASVTPASVAEHGDFMGTLTSSAFPTFCVLGVFGNLIVLVVWSSASDFNATVFFMKGLAVSDIFLLLVNFIRWLVDRTTGTVELFVLRSLELYSAVVGTTTTLVLVFTRWVSVHRPMEVKILLPKRRVALMYGVVQLCGVLATSFAASMPNLIMYTINYTVFLILPILMTVCLNVSLVSKVCIHRANSTLGQQQQQQSAQAARSSHLNRMVAAVVCVSVTTMLAYPVAFALIYIDHFWVPFSFKVASVVLPLQCFNSSINVVYYLIFASHFRKLFRQKIRCLFCRQDQPYATSTV